MAKRPKKKRGEDWDRDTASLAGRITTRMEELRLSPSDLAAHCKVSVTAVGWWLRGETKNLKLEYFFALADKLQVEPRWLGINEGPMLRGELLQYLLDQMGSLRSKIEDERHRTVEGLQREFSPPESETSRVTDSTKPAKKETTVKKS